MARAIKKLLQYLIIISFALSISITCYAYPTFGIVTAVPAEANIVLSNMKNKHAVTNGIYHYTLGQLGNYHVALLIMGAGIVNAATATTNMINAFNPEYLLLTGTAGGVDHSLHVGDVVIVKNATLFDAGNQNSVHPKWPDFPPNPVRGVKDPVTFESSKLLLNHAIHLTYNGLSSYTQSVKKIPAKIIAGSMATTDHFPNSTSDALRMRAMHMDATAMETASFMKVCWLYQKPCLAFRGISDLIKSTEKATYYTAWNNHNATLAANHAGKLLVEFVKSFSMKKKN